MLLTRKLKLRLVDAHDNFFNENAHIQILIWIKQIKDYLIKYSWRSSIEPIILPYNSCMSVTRSDEITPRITRGESLEYLQEFCSKSYIKENKLNNLTRIKGETMHPFILL